MIQQFENTYDVTVIGGGPAGLAAAVSAWEVGAKTLLVEREENLGGILKQCIHDGFGLLMFKQKLTGPEYAQYYIEMLKNTDVNITCSTFVTDINRQDDGIFHLILVTHHGIKHIYTKAIVLATGCRERSAKQIFIHGKACRNIDSRYSTVLCEYSRSDACKKMCNTWIRRYWPYYGKKAYFRRS